MAFYICVGRTSPEFQTTSSAVFTVTIVVSLLLNVVINVRIKWFQSQNLVQPFEAPNHQHYLSTDINFDTLSNSILDICGMAVIAVSIIFKHRLNQVDMDKLNAYPNNLYLYYVNLVAIGLCADLLITSFFLKKAIRKSFKEEFCRIFNL
jgi:hypothetical protein